MSHISSVLFIVVVILSSLGTLANAAIIYGIFRSEKLKTISNIFLANLAIAALLSIIITPFVQFVLFDIKSPVCICVTMSLTVMLHFAVILFGILLSVDCFINFYCPEASKKFRSFYSVVIKVIWLTALQFYIFNAGLCLYNSCDCYITNAMFLVFFVINLLFVIILQCSRLVQTCRTDSFVYPNVLNVRLVVITIITSSYLIALIYVKLKYSEEYSRHAPSYFGTFHTAFILALTLAVASIVTLGVLCRFDRGFRSGFFSTRSDNSEKLEHGISLICRNKDVSSDSCKEKSIYI